MLDCDLGASSYRAHLARCVTRRVLLRLYLRHCLLLPLPPLLQLLLLQLLLLQLLLLQLLLLLLQLLLLPSRAHLPFTRVDSVQQLQLQLSRATAATAAAATVSWQLCSAQLSEQLRDGALYILGNLILVQIVLRVIIQLHHTALRAMSRTATWAACELLVLRLLDLTCVP
jgi:hypothetical protein